MKKSMPTNKTAYRWNLQHNSICIRGQNKAHFRKLWPRVRTERLKKMDIISSSKVGAIKGRRHSTFKTYQQASNVWLNTGTIEYFHELNIGTYVEGRKGAVSYLGECAEMSKCPVGLNETPKHTTVQQQPSWWKKTLPPRSIMGSDQYRHRSTFYFNRLSKCPKTSCVSFAPFKRPSSATLANELMNSIPVTQLLYLLQMREVFDPCLVLYTDRCSLRDPHRVELLQEAVLDTLRSHCAYRCGALSCSSRPGAGRLMVARALNGLVELRPVARQSATVLRQLLSVECATNDYHTSVLKDSLSELHEI